MQTGQVTITHEVGLHARPAALFVKTASRFGSRISVEAGPKTANAKSIVQVLTLGARQNTVLTITAEGDDEADAVRTLVRLVESDFAADA